MSAFSVSKSIEIDATLEDTFEYLREFKNWKAWSPWLICDPECQLEFSDDGKSYNWSGEFAGMGSMEITEESKDRQIDYALKFQKPWKSKADVRLSCERVGAKITVTWSMQSKLPFFMFWMKKMMISMIGMDYERGLKMLKEQLEGGYVSSSLDWLGVQKVAGCQYIGLQRECRFDQMEQKMDKDFKKLKELVEQANLEKAGHYFTFYKNWEISKGLVSYEICCPVSTELLSLPDGMISGMRPALSAYVVGHTGSYQHLGNAWSAAMSRARAKLFKQSKKHMPFEQYVSLPEEVGEKSTVTLVCLPVR